MGYFTPVVLLLAAVGVGVANATNPSVVWYMPFEVMWPDLRGNVRLQGQYTVATFAALGLLTFARAWFSRDRDPPIG